MPEPSDVSIGAINLKESIEITEGNEDALEDIVDVVIDLFVKRIAKSRTN